MFFLNHKCVCCAYIRVCFCVQRAAHGFQPQMKLEAVDKRSPGLIRVATVEEVDTHRIKVTLRVCGNVGALSGLHSKYQTRSHQENLCPRCFPPQVHYDGWSHVYDEWMDSDHPDIHPAGWCEATSHPLKIPPRDTKTQQPHGSSLRFTLLLF